MIEGKLPGIYVHSMEIGANVIEDEANGFLMNCNKQIEYAHRQIANDSNLAKGFNAIGFSQGSQFLRAYVERFNDPPVYNLISIGGQHQGVFGFPNCPGANETLCGYLRDFINIGAYDPFVQEHSTQCGYWQDPFNEEEYLAKNVFLPDINNNLDVKNETYKQNLMSLENFVMVMFDNDTLVQPKESEWFAWYIPGQAKQIQYLRDSPIYTEDWLGLKVMDQQGKLAFLSTIGNHLQFTDTWFYANIVPYLNNTLDYFF